MSRKRRARRTAVAVVAWGCIALVGACSGAVAHEQNDSGVAPSSGGDPDLGPSASPSDAGADVDICDWYEDQPGFNETHPALHGPCSPTVPCDPRLDCIYKPGCDMPEGTCERWARCNDSAIAHVSCLCTGQTGHERLAPISAWGDACAPDAHDD